MNCVVVISEGVAKLRELPEHGEYKIVMHRGKVRRMRREEGEEF
ncbi:XtrA/YqaO family protein [Sporosarcina sp. P25]